MPTQLLILGGTGFIGRHLVRRFAGDERYVVTATHHAQPPFEVAGVEWLHADLRYDEDVRAVVAGQEVIVQAASAPSSVEGNGGAAARNEITDNAVMNALLLRAAYEAAAAHYVFFSCASVYGSTIEPAREDDAPRPHADAGSMGLEWTKRYIERLCAFYAALGRSRHMVIRHAPVYGPPGLREAHTRLNDIIIALLRATDSEPTTLPGEAVSALDCLYVDDLVEFVHRALTLGAPSTVCNVGSGHHVTWREIVQAVERLKSRPCRIVYDPTRSAPASAHLDIRRARDLFGWTPVIGLIEGLGRILESSKAPAIGPASVRQIA